MNLIYDEKTQVGILKDKICPFRNPLILPGQFAGQVTIENIPCTTSCALFETNTITNVLTECTLNCGSSKLKFVAEIIKPKELKIV